MNMILTLRIQSSTRIAIATILLGSLLLPFSLFAQSSVVLSVSPTLFEMSANPEQTWSSSVRVINANPFPIRVYAEPVNFAPSGEAGEGTLTPVFADEAEGGTLAEWIAITDEEIVIDPEQTVSVPFRISVPDDAAPGGHFAAILIGTRPFNDAADQAQVQTSQVVTSLVFLRVAGDIQESGRIRDFTSSQAIYERPDTTLSVRFENTGNVHLQPQGEIEIRNMWGQERGRIPINKNSQFGNVLPESIRTYNYQWESEWSVADIGRHTADITLAYGDQTRQFADATTHFWIIPWKPLLLLGLLLAGFIWLMTWGVKQYIRRMLTLAGVTPELQRQATQPQKRRVSVVAPIEAGILDLRTELEEGTGTFMARLWSFARKYRAFWLVFLAVLVFVGLLLWYIVLVVRNDFSYEVSYEQPDGTTVPIPSDTVSIDEARLQGADIVVINHSDSADGFTQIESILSDLPYNISEGGEPFDGVKERSVLVYNPEYLTVVEVLQERLPNVLVSSYVSEDDTDAPLILYLGNDLVE